MTKDKKRRTGPDILLLEHILDTFGPALTLEALRHLLFTTREAAKYLGITVSALNHDVRAAKDIEPTKIGGRLFYTKDQLDKLQATTAASPRPPEQDTA